MLFEDFLFMLDCMQEGLQEEQREKKLLESFNAWQITEIVKALLSEESKGISFEEYSKNLGIMEREETTEEERKREKAIALKTAEEILKLDRGQIA